MREIDALGGEMGKIADATGINFKMLNKSKGPQFGLPRSQNDREEYAAEAQKRILHQTNLDVLEDSLCELIVEDDSLRAIRTSVFGAH